MGRELQRVETEALPGTALSLGSKAEAGQNSSGGQVSAVCLKDTVVPLFLTHLYLLLLMFNFKTILNDAFKWKRLTLDP